MRWSTAPTCQPRLRLTRQSRSPRSTAAPTRPVSSTACSARLPASGELSLERGASKPASLVLRAASEARGLDVNRLREISERLTAIARELEGGELGDARAAELAHEAAELSSEAVEEANRRIREDQGSSA